MPTTASPTTVVIVDDAPLMRRLVGRLCEHTDGLRLIGSAGDGPSGYDAVLAACPTVAIVDLDLPGFSGLELCRRISTAPGRCRPQLILWSGLGRPREEELTAAGVTRFVRKQDGLNCLLKAATN